VTWKHALNGTLRRATGFELRKVKPPDAPGPYTRKRSRQFAGTRAGDRLVQRPAFILCSLRSGSTLLRVLLNSHSQIHAPHEFHLRYIGVKLRSKWASKAMLARDLDVTALDYLLWDRILHWELTKSGKQQIVVKTPNDVFNVDRILECWPDARFIFLLRHPAAIARSRASLRDGVDEMRNAERIQIYCDALEAARRAHPGHTIRYEDLTSDPAAATQALCEFLGVPWEPGMLDYGRFDHGGFGAGLGDWKEKIKTGSVQPPATMPTPEETPPALRELAAAWGYLTVEEPSAAAISTGGAAQSSAGSSTS
jgi:hypothetical protein